MSLVWYCSVCNTGPYDVDMYDACPNCGHIRDDNDTIEILSRRFNSSQAYVGNACRRLPDQQSHATDEIIAVNALSLVSPRSRSRGLMAGHMVGFQAKHGHYFHPESTYAEAGLANTAAAISSTDELHQAQGRYPIG